MFHLRLLGGVCLKGPAGPLTGRVVQRRRLAFLALLAAAGDKGESRDTLLGYLWPETSEATARRLLSSSLYVLRQALGDNSLLAAGEVLRLNPEVVSVDVSAFEAALEEGNLERGVQLYGGSFLEGFHAGAGPQFEHWRDAESRRLADRYAQALESLARAADAAGEHSGAVAWWKRLVAHDPHNSRFAQCLIEALAASGDRAGAIEHLRAHERLLRDELEVEPPPDLLALHERLRHPVAGAKRAPPDQPGQAAPGEPSHPAGDLNRGWLWQVLLVYLGGAWACYEAIKAITGRMALPDWLPMLAIVLLLIGLPFVVTIRRRRPWTWRVAGLSFITALALWAGVATGWLLIAGRGQPAEARTALLVLPFENLGPVEDAYFADGVTEEITARLATVSRLNVVGRTTAIRYRHSVKTVREIGEELGVNYILEGTVRWQRPPEGPGRVRVTPQLLRASDGAHVWAEVYDTLFADIFEVQQAVADRVVEAMGITLLDPEGRYLTARPTANLRAYDFYLRGREQLRASGTRTSFHSAREMFEEAVRLDSAFALAYAWLGFSRGAIWWLGYDDTAALLSAARSAAEEALRLDPNLPDAHFALGAYWYFCCPDFDRSVMHLQRATARRESTFLLMLANVRKRRGEWRRALDDYRQAAIVDPRNVWVPVNQAMIHIWLREYSQAVDRLNEALSLDPKNLYPYLFQAWVALLVDGSTREARRLIDEAPERVPSSQGRALPFYLALLERDYQRALAELPEREGDLDVSTEYPTERVGNYIRRAMVYRLEGQLQTARAYYDSARVEAEHQLRWRARGKRTECQLRVLLATAYAGLGQRKRALREEKAVLTLDPLKTDAIIGPNQIHDLAVMNVMIGELNAALDKIGQLLSMPAPFSQHLLRLDPRWDPLRERPRFKALQARTDS